MSITDWDAFRHDLTQVPAIWNGGLSIFGAVLGGMLGVWIGCRRVKLPFWQVADCIAPGLVLAQALGRWGNYFNQELYGKPTNRPWGVEIDPQHRVAPYQNNQTFQPTFLYESILNLIVFVILIRFSRRYWNRVPYGTVFALYVTLYDLYRVPLETLKIDTADIVFGQRINFWVSAVLFVVGRSPSWCCSAAGTRRPRRPSRPTEPVEYGGHTPTARARGRDRGPPAVAAQEEA